MSYGKVLLGAVLVAVLTKAPTQVAVDLAKGTGRAIVGGAEKVESYVRADEKRQADQFAAALTPAITTAMASQQPQTVVIKFEPQSSNAVATLTPSR